jgi:hypothetical protein
LSKPGKWHTPPRWSVDQLHDRQNHAKLMAWKTAQARRLA